MPRKKRCRKIENVPEHRQFGPLNYESVEIINLTLVELEAVRLKDIEKLNQEECANKMEVSRQTFQNILGKAREKIAKAIIKGNKIEIEGGNYRFKKCEMKCGTCEARFNE